MKWNKADFLQVFIGLIPVWIALIFYNELPVRMATHINTNNEVDGYMSRPAAIALLVALGVGVPFLTKISRRIDPKRENYLKFEGAFRIFRWTMSGFICFVGLFLVAYNLGYDISPSWIGSFFIGLLFIVIGNFMGQIRFNYTMGIRTPWTLADETVWRKTHRMAAPIWVFAGILLIGTAFAPAAWSPWLTMSIIGIVVVVPSAYSYWAHKTLKG